MEKSERETIILLNQGDMSNGFFRISTRGLPSHTRRIEMRLKKLGVNYQKDQEGNYKIPVEALSIAQLCIRSLSGVDKKGVLPAGFISQDRDDENQPVKPAGGA